MGEVGGMHLVKLDRRRKNRRKGGGSLIEGRGGGGGGQEEGSHEFNKVLVSIALSSFSGPGLLHAGCHGNCRATYAHSQQNYRGNAY